MSSKRRKGRKTEQGYRIAMLLFPLLLFLAGGGYVYAKYYSQSARAGIAIASGIYFTANYAVSVEEDGEFYESVVKSDYQGNEYSFNFEVRNYENNLLFNESGVDIPYSLSFWLGETPSGATYTVVSNGATYELKEGEEEKIEITGQSVAGGSAMANSYVISIKPSDSTATHEAVPIFVEVKTGESSIVSKTLRGKMVLNNVERPVSFIESQGFILPDKTTDVTTVTFEQIEELSELTYEIRTVGEVLASDEPTEELKLSWDATVFELDLFDSVYLEWLKNNPDETGPKDDSTAGWKYITIKVMPYSAETIGFFRGTEYRNKVTDIASLHEFIEAEKYQTNSEGTNG